MRDTSGFPSPPKSTVVRGNKVHQPDAIVPATSGIGELAITSQMDRLPPFQPAVSQGERQATVGLWPSEDNQSPWRQVASLPQHGTFALPAGTATALVVSPTASVRKQRSSQRSSLLRNVSWADETLRGRDIVGGTACANPPPTGKTNAISPSGKAFVAEQSVIERIQVPHDAV
jgi:hypothetical protein